MEPSKVSRLALELMFPPSELVGAASNPGHDYELWTRQGCRVKRCPTRLRRFQARLPDTSATHSSMLDQIMAPRQKLWCECSGLVVRPWRCGSSNSLAYRTQLLAEGSGSRDRCRLLEHSELRLATMPGSLP
jgi:hypothetical protein